MSTPFYDTDLTDAAWAWVAPLLPAARPGGRPRTTNLRAVLNAIFYLLRTGCQWRLLPREFPPCGTVYHYFQGWQSSGVWVHLHRVLYEQAREARGGYGYVMTVPGVVTKLADKRVEVAVPSQSKQTRTRVGSITSPDSQWSRVTRWVKPEKLVPRHTRASPEEVARLIESEPEKKPMDKIQVRQIDDPERDRAQREEPERQYLTVPYAEREEAKAAGAKWDWREKLWYIGPEGTRDGLAKWLPENAAAAAPKASPREEFADVLRELGGDLTAEHPIMDGRPHMMATLDD